MAPFPFDRRRLFLGGLAAGAAAALEPTLLRGADEAPAAPPPPKLPPPPAELESRTVADLAKAMGSGELTSRRLVELCLARIEAVDPAIASVVEVNPEALALADRLDAERREGRGRGLLHGIPVLLKDNIDTADRMATTAGSLALAGAPTPADSGVAARLRAGGAVLLGKTNLSEWANFRSTRSSSGWSARGGLTRNPHVLDRSACGSSSGSGAAVAAGLAPLAVGTETDGSIVCPSSICGIVGIKPTVGLVSRAGIIPISATQDTAGPMARSVEDALRLLVALSGRDERDTATALIPAGRELDPARILDAGALRGARIGVARNQAGFHAAVDRALDDAVAALQGAGAVVVDPADLPGTGSFDADELEVMFFEFKDGLERYLAGRFGAAEGPKTLKALIAFNEREKERELAWFGQEIFEKAAAKGGLSDPKYRTALANCRKRAWTDGLAKTLRKHRLDALVLPSNGPAWTIDLVNGDHYLGGNSSWAAVSGTPTVTVPMGFVAGLPLGLSFLGGRWEEGKLLGLAYAFEQATKARRPPAFLPSIVPADPR